MRDEDRLNEFTEQVLLYHAASHVPKRSMKKEVAAEIRSILNAPDETEAKWQLDRVVKKYAQSAPELSNWLEHNVPESLTVMSYPAHHRRRLGTSNLAERVNRELKRRTSDVATLFRTEKQLTYEGLLVVNR